MFNITLNHHLSSCLKPFAVRGMILQLLDTGVTAGPQGDLHHIRSTQSLDAEPTNWALWSSLVNFSAWHVRVSDIRPGGRGPACSSVRWGTPKNVYRPSRDDSISTHGHMCHMSDVWYTLLGLPQYLKYKRLSCALSGLDLWLHSWMVHIDLLGCAIHRRFQRAPLRGEGGNQGNHLNFWWRRDFKCRISGPRKGV